MEDILAVLPYDKNVVRVTPLMWIINDGTVKEPLYEGSATLSDLYVSRPPAAGFLIAKGGDLGSHMLVDIGDLRVTDDHKVVLGNHWLYNSLDTAVMSGILKLKA